MPNTVTNSRLQGIWWLEYISIVQHTNDILDKKCITVYNYSRLLIVQTCHFLSFFSLKDIKTYYLLIKLLKLFQSEDKQGCTINSIRSAAQYTTKHIGTYTFFVSARQTMLGHRSVLYGQKERQHWVWLCAV